MLSYFFIPATKLDKIPFISKLDVSEIIIDFEDAILIEDRERLILNLTSIPNYKSLWYRIPVKDDLSGSVDVSFLNLFLEIGIRKIMLPKLKSKFDFEGLLKKVDHFSDLSFIVLIEHPRLLLELGQILQTESLEKYIYGIGLGSHDLTTFLGASHKPNQLFFPRIQALYLAKGYGKLAIDIASMNISSKEEFENELLFGLENGFDAKLIIHPIQFNWMVEFAGNEELEILWAEKVLSSLPSGHLGNEVEPFILDGQIIEKPHVERAQKIINKYRHGK
jgi:citrate lyase beta subunit